MKENKLAVLIDADNVPHANIKEMREEIAKKGTPTIKRIYADWTKQTLSGILLPPMAFLYQVHSALQQKKK